MHPQRLYGEPSASDAPGYAALASLPLMNLLALACAGARGGPARAFTVVMSWANRIGVVCVALFGVTSCLELSYSPAEIVATVFLVVPPLVTTLALRASTSRPVRRTIGVVNVVRSDEAAQQRDAADEAEHNGASQLISVFDGPIWRA